MRMRDVPGAQFYLVPSRCSTPVQLGRECLHFRDVSLTLPLTAHLVSPPVN